MTKSAWKRLYENHSYFHDLLQKHILVLFYSVMRPIMNKSKKQYLNIVNRRARWADFKQIFMMSDKDENDLENLVIKTFNIWKGVVKVETMLMFDRMKRLLNRAQVKDDDEEKKDEKKFNKNDDKKDIFELQELGVTDEMEEICADTDIRLDNIEKELKPIIDWLVEKHS